MTDNYVLEQESAYECGNDGRSFPVTVYKHKATEFRVVICQVPGPLCHLALCMPTLCADHKGKPHSLEHLVFCGSEKYPYRGYIDVVASQNLGQPMNATTYSDMTIFKFVGLGQEAAANVLPVALDHVMHPLIQDNHFATEVYHVDQDGRQQGVLLSEMSEFSYKEASVRSLSLRQMLYPSSSTYAWESGGLLQSIEVLTTKEVEEYHKEFYNYQNLTLLLVGAYDKHPDAIFNVLAGLDSEIAASPPAPKRTMPPPRTKRDKRRNDVVFPSEKSQTGTMGFAWEGPPTEDVETQIALEVLLDFLKNDPGSPLRKRFTNRAVPIAGEIELLLKPFIPSMIELSFLEVPFTSYISHAAAAAANSSRQDASLLSNYPSPVDAFGPLDISKLHDDVNSLFAPNYYRKQLVSTLSYIVEYWLPKNWLYFCDFIVKRNASAVDAFAKVAMDQKAKDGILYMLAHDAIAYHYSPGFADKMQPAFASRGCAFSIRCELEQRDCAFWQELVKKWFLDRQMVHIAMIPDPKMGIQLEAERNLAQRNRIESKSPEELEKLREWVGEAIASTKISIPHDVLAAVPPIPDISQVQMPEFVGHSFQLNNPPFAPSPFGTGRVLIVPSETEARLQISFPLANLDSDLRPYLPLFTKLLTSSTGLIVSSSFVNEMGQCPYLPALKLTGMPLIFVDNERVDSAFNNVFTDYNACIGDYLSCGDGGGWPVEVMTLYGATQSKAVHGAFKLLILKLLFGDFGVDEVLKSAKRQEKELTRLKGTGASLLIDTYQWLRTPGLLDANTVAGAESSENTVIERSANEPLGRALNLYYQSSFISAVSKSLSLAVKGDNKVAAQTNRIIDAISRIRAYFANSVLGTGLAHITLPQSMNNTAARKMMERIVDEWVFCSAAWRDNHQIIAVPDSPDSPYEPTVQYNTSNDTGENPRKKRRSTGTVAAKDSTCHSPNFREGSCEFVALESALGIHLALADLPTSYVGIQVPLYLQHGLASTAVVPFEQQLKSLPETDVWALSMLTTIFNRSEGLVKNAVRGRGYAYGVGIHPRPADGHLAVYISHSSDPQKALEAFWEVMEQLRSDDEWDKAIDEFQLRAARSIVLFRTHNNAAQSIALEDAYWLFRGFSGLDKRMVWVRKHVESITVTDLRRVFLKYFIPIISADSPVKALYVIAIPQFLVDTDRDPMHMLKRNPYGIQPKHIDFALLDPVINI
ncbi:hypothetical protein GGI25_001317 [Coemansia spiralis]|uniref:Uncharacterized protein n=2 Tax=Coemansia TaxID=4863 RepID=A0A9W8G690_9FUNG|nr:hypothetical protein EDC05_001179 [Coemansia umbellata]KAJ2624018.1 hypothetical protein GGI26_001811 [Coemansia sp. RSA 1358]KAJ2679627.1 hypothetical protein GGI25_001317 [Coemansia spiralis]